MVHHLLSYIQQWGRSNGSGSNITVYFPISFSNQALMIVSSSSFASINSLNANSATINDTSMGGSWKPAFFYLVLGFWQWIRSDQTTNEHSSITFNFPIAFNTCFWCGGLGWSNGIWGSNYQGGGVYSFTATNFVWIGADNGNCNVLALAFGIA